MFEPVKFLARKRIRGLDNVNFLNRKEGKKYFASLQFHITWCNGSDSFLSGF